MQSYGNLVGADWEQAIDGKTFEDRNPADHDDLIGVFPLSSADDVDKAVRAAKAAFPAWSEVPAPQRGEILFRVAARLASQIDELGELVVREMGKSLFEGRADVQEAIDLAYFMGGETRRPSGQVAESELPNRLGFTMQMPIGVVAAITPWNFPIALVAMKVMPALAAGNTVVLKPAEDTPLSANKLVEMFLECGLPPGVLNVVHGMGEVVGRALVRHPDVDMVSFTGSSEVGAEISEACSRSFKRVLLEMGGKNAIIVLDDADIKNALDGVVWSAFGTSGQRCTAASRIIVHEKIAENFAQELAERAKVLTLGNHLKSKIDVGPIINMKQRDRIHEYVDIGLREGARVLVGGEIAADGDLSRGAFYSPTVFTDVRPEMRIAQEEIFGPVTAVIKATGFEDALKILGGVDYGLSCSLFTNDVNKALSYIKKARVGMVYLNTHTIGGEIHLPFGGFRRSGNGLRECGWTAMDAYTETKTVYADYSQRLQRPMIEH